MKTFIPKKESIERQWFIVDAAEKAVGRVATEVAKVLRGKNKPTFTPHLDTGDGVVVINAEKVLLTGNKWTQKKYYRYSGYVGNVKETTAEKMLEKNPVFILENAIAGMIPRTKFKKEILKRLKVNVGETHRQEAQQPIALEIA
jgi:large subunit ribosomal protein L13